MIKESLEELENLEEDMYTIYGYMDEDGRRCNIYMPGGIRRIPDMPDFSPAEEVYCFDFKEEAENYLEVARAYYLEDAEEYDRIHVVPVTPDFLGSGNFELKTIHPNM
jgi:hypothetical protein